MKRYELSVNQWRRIEHMVPGKEGDRGRTGVDNRKFVNAVLWILRLGARWSDLSESYGKYKSVHKRFTRWAKKGVWNKIFEDLAKDRDMENVVIFLRQYLY